MPINYRPGPTGRKFLLSRAFIKIIMGPVGGGKSTVALFDLLYRAMNQKPYNNVRRTKFIILRNTMQQLKTTVKPLLDQWFVTMTDNTFGQWRLTENTYEVHTPLPDGTIMHTEFVMMAADTPDDVRRLLSMECSAAWVEEAREVDPEVFSGLQGRVARFPSRAAGGVTYPGVICSTNPPPVGGFWHGIISSPPSNTEVFIQPPALLDDGSINPDAENLKNLDPSYYDNLIAGKTEDWINVYLKNQFGAGDLGQPIYKASFRKSFHVATKPLEPVLGSVNPLIVGMDNGLQAAAVIGQQDMRGRVNVLAEAYVPEDQTMGVESFLDKVLLPVVTSRFATFPRNKIVFVVDPACFQRSQVDEKTIAQAIQQRGFSVVKASTNDPERRVQAAEGLFTRQIDAGPGILIDPSCQHLINTLEWGHRWKKTASGLTSTVAEKNHYSHCFVAGTMVETTVGPVPIEQITCDHRVLTPKGEQPVVATMSHHSSDLFELAFSDGTTLICTGDHPFFTERGVVVANTLAYNEVLFSLEKAQCLEQDTQSRSSTEFGTTESRPGTTNPTTTSTAVGTCTEMSGRATTGPSQMDVTSTTSTATKPTTGLRTWLAWLPRSTSATTPGSATQHLTAWLRRWLRWRKPNQKLLSGTDQKQAAHGTLSTDEGLGKGDSGRSFSAPTAKSRISGLLRWLNAGFARRRAKACSERSPGLTTRPDSASSAGATSGATGTPRPERAVRLVGKRHLLGQSAKVYDLTVLDEHCFYANGIRVSNCGDAFQYFCLHYNLVAPGQSYQLRAQARPVAKRAYVYS